MIDMKGKRCGRLTVLRKAGTEHQRKKQPLYWLCRCECGLYLVENGKRLRNGDARQCSVCAGRGMTSKFVRIEKGEPE